MKQNLRDLGCDTPKNWVTYSVMFVMQQRYPLYVKYRTEFRIAKRNLQF
jgi:hypothetical protein